MWVTLTNVQDEALPNVWALGDQKNGSPVSAVVGVFHPHLLPRLCFAGEEPLQRGNQLVVARNIDRVLDFIWQVVEVCEWMAFNGENWFIAKCNNRKQNFYQVDIGLQRSMIERSMEVEAITRCIVGERERRQSCSSSLWCSAEVCDTLV